MIVVENLNKVFRIPHEKKNTLFHTFFSFSKGAYQYEEFHALRDVSFRVQKGETVGIIGKNGSGKSTLLKIIANIYRPTSGNVVVNDEVFPLLELGVGFQPNFTVRDNIYLYGSFLGFTRREMSERITRVLEFAELTRFADAKLDNLSTGMKSRLGYAIAIQGDAPIHLLDEILAVGDEVFRQKCRERFRSTRNEGRTILYVSHDLGSVEEFCDSAILLHHGQIVNMGFPDLVIQEYRKMIAMEETA